MTDALGARGNYIVNKLKDNIICFGILLQLIKRANDTSMQFEQWESWHEFCLINAERDPCLAGQIRTK